MSDDAPPGGLPDDILWRLQRAEGFLDLNMIDRCLKELALIPEEHHATRPYRVVRLRLAFSQHDWTLAADLARGLREETPADPALWVSLAYATRRCVGIDAARDILLEAVERFPKEPIIPFNLACYECRLGRNDVARGFLDKAIALDKDCLDRAQEDEDLKPLWPELG